MEAIQEEVKVRIGAIDEVAPWVRRFGFVPALPGGLPPFDSGDRIDVRLGEGVWCPFSLTNAPAGADRYEIMLRGKERSRPSATHGLFHDAAVGDLVSVRRPVPGLRLAAAAARHVFIAGGTGLTAFLSHIDKLEADGAAPELHYACHAPMRSLVDGLAARLDGRLRCYVSEKGERLDPDALLADLAGDAHVYVCGPVALVESVVQAAITRHWPLRKVHWDKGVRLDIPWRQHIKGDSCALDPA